MIVACLLALLSFSFVLFAFSKLGLLDSPERYGHSRSPIPYPAGLALALAYLASVFLSGVDEAILGALGLSMVLLLVSFVDDRFRLPSWLRLGVQVLAMLGLWFLGFQIEWIQSPFGGLLNLDFIPFFALAFFVFWGLSLMNAMNWLDEIPGMSLGMTAIASFTIYLLSLRPDLHTLDQGTVQSLLTLLAPFLLIFFFGQWPKPRFLLGDSGSIFFGFLLALVSVVSGAKVATLLTVLALPLVDFFMVIVRRLLRRQSPFKGDYSHLHHRLMAASWSNTKILAFYFSLAVLMSLLAIYASTPMKIFGLLFFFFGLLFFDLLYLSRFPFDPLIHPHHARH